MHPATLAARRMVAQAALLLAVVGLTFLVTVLTTGIPRYQGLAAVASVRETIANAPAQDAAVQAQIRLADDAPAQDAAVRAVLERSLAETSATIYRTVQSPPVDAVLPDGSTEQLLLAADPEFIERTSIEEGVWPSTAGDSIPVAMQAQAVEALGLEVGDPIRLGSKELEIVATWLPLDPSDPYWLDDSAVTTGEAAGSFGPLVMAEDALADLDVNPFARWTVTPDVARMTASELPALGTAVRSMEQTIRAEPGLAPGGLVFVGDLGATATTLERSVDSVRGVSPVPLVLAGVIGLLALIQLARLLAGVRAQETLLLRARGRSRTQATIAAAIEGALVTIPAAAAGAGIALLVTATDAVPAADAWLTAALVAAVGILGLTVVAWQAAGPRAGRPSDSEFATTGATIGAVALTLIAAGISLWQFRLYGSPLVTTASGERIVDPIAVLAPSLALLAVAVLALTAFAPLASLLAKLAARSSGIEPVLPVRQVARRVSTFAVPLLLVCLSVGGTTLAAAYSGTWSALNSRAGELRNGSDVRVRLAASGSVGSAAAIVSSPRYAVDGALATPVLLAETESGEESVTLLGIAAAEIPMVMGSLGGTIDREAIAAAVGSGSSGIQLPQDAATLTLTTASTTTTDEPLAPGQGDIVTTVWVHDAQGALARLVLEPMEQDGVVSAELPAGVAPWSITAVDATITTGVFAASYGYEVTAITTLAAEGASTGVELAAKPWRAQPELSPALDPKQIHGLGQLGVTVDVDRPGPPTTVRLMSDDVTSDGAAAPLPVVVTDSFARLLGLAEGDTTRLRFAGSGLALAVEVRDTVRLLPGTTNAFGVLADLRAIDAHLLRSASTVPRPNQIWLATDDPAATSAQLASIVPPGARVTTVTSGSGDALLRPVVTALWIGGGGALLLAAAALAAVTGALARARHPEVVVLKALGLSDAQQARGRRNELLVVVGFAVLVGAIGGLLVSLLTVSELARSAVLDAPAALPADLSFDLLPAAALLVVFLALVAVIVAGYGIRVRRQAAASTGRELGQ